jgi:hypothetical protein
MQRCKIIKGWDSTQLEHRINTWLSEGNYGSCSRRILHISYSHAEGMDKALIIYEDGWV